MRRLLVMIGLAVAATAGLGATEVQRWQVDTATEMLSGEGFGVAVTADGRLEAVPRWSDRVELEEPMVMVGGTTAEGALVVATGHPARLYRIADADPELLAELPGEQATALLVTSEGDILVGLMAPGMLVRYRDGRLTELGRLGEGGIWDLLEHDGTVVAAAGPPATLYRVGDRGIERWLELPDAHARCLVEARGRLVVGTSGKGLIMAVVEGGVSLLADSPFTEISDMATASDGSLWAAALVGEPAKSSAPSEGASPSSDGEGTGESAAAGTVDLDLPKVDGATATSEVLRLTPEGALLRVHRFADQVATAVSWDGEGVLVGTGFEGQIWRFVEGGGARLATVDAVQVVAFLEGGRAALSQGPAAVLRRAGTVGEARFRIDARSFERPVHLGRYAVDPADGDARIRFRSGGSEDPDGTWMPWTGWLPAEGEVPLPTAKALQWEVELGEADVERVEVAFREVNLAPEITSLGVEAPGVVYLGSPPRSGPVIEVTNPDFNGIFTVVDENGGSSAGPGKKYYRTGFRTVVWEASDPNGDPLRFTVEVETTDGLRLPVETRLESTRLALDTTAVPDGRYRFVVEVSDRAANPAAPLESSRVSSWFIVDNTPPRVEVESASGGGWSVRVTDAGSAVSRVEYSVDGEPWIGLTPEDGVLDGPEESFELPAAGDARLLVVRAVDRHHNRVTRGVRKE